MRGGAPLTHASRLISTINVACSANKIDAARTLAVRAWSKDASSCHRKRAPGPHVKRHSTAMQTENRTGERRDRDDQNRRRSQADEQAKTNQCDHRVDPGQYCRGPDRK